MILDRFLLNSDYPLDQIVYFKSFEVTVASGSTTINENIPHDLGFKPLLFGVYATKADFSDSIGMSDGLFSVLARGYDDHIEVFGGDFTAGTKVYVRVYGFAPASYKGFCKSTATSSKPLIISTDYEYAPLIFEAEVTCTSYDDEDPYIVEGYDVTKGYLSVVTKAASISVRHDLEYKPSVMTWTENNGYTQLSFSAEFEYEAGWFSSQIPNTVVTDVGFDVTTGPASTAGPKIHIRAYADGN